MTSSATKPVRVAVAMLGPCSLISLSAVVDTLSEANRQAKVSLFAVTVYRPSWPLPMQHTSAWLANLPRLSEPPECDWLWTIADELVLPADPVPVAERLAGAAVKARLLACTGHGAWWLARAGLLDGHAVSVHTSLYDRFIHEFPDVLANQRLFDIDGNRASSAGGLATIDLLLTLLTQRHGAALAERVAQALNASPTRTRQTLQATTGLSLAARQEPRLMEALHLMETNLSEPLSTQETARLVGLSRRHLERLFRLHLQAQPAAWYMDLRLDHAHALLQQTSRPIAVIAKDSGFKSAQYFSYAYRRRFNQRPGDLRKGS